MDLYALNELVICVGFIEACWPLDQVNINYKKNYESNLLKPQTIRPVLVNYCLFYLMDKRIMHMSYLLSLYIVYRLNN
jgi:hypothetical protein